MTHFTTSSIIYHIFSILGKKYWKAYFLLSYVGHLFFHVIWSFSQSIFLVHVTRFSQKIFLDALTTLNSIFIKCKLSFISLCYKIKRERTKIRWSDVHKEPFSKCHRYGFYFINRGGSFYKYACFVLSHLL